MSFSVIRECASCHARNRVSARHLADTGRCGTCKAALGPQSEPIEVNASAFDEITSLAKVPVLTDFWAAWCGPCRAAAPEVKALAQETAGKALVLKVNTEEEPELSARFGVQSIPNFLVMRGGRVVLQRPGLASRAEMRRWLEG